MGAAITENLKSLTLEILLCRFEPQACERIPVGNPWHVEQHNRATMSFSYQLGYTQQSLCYPLLNHPKQTHTSFSGGLLVKYHELLDFEILVPW